MASIDRLFSCDHCYVVKCMEITEVRECIEMMAESPSHVPTRSPAGMGMELGYLDTPVCLHVCRYCLLVPADKRMPT